MEVLKRNNTGIWVMTAIFEEFDHKDTNICYTNIGKITAAIATQHIIDTQHPKMIVNLGTAGSSTFDYGEIVNCHQFVQRDMNLTAFLSPQFSIPGSNDAQILDYGHKNPRFKSAICGTGDTFVRDIEKNIWDCVDMESFAIAYACHATNIKFACYKFISDGKSDNTTDQQFMNVLKNAKAALNELYGNVRNDLINSA